MRRAAVEILSFDGGHLPGVLALCEAEGWPSLPSDPARAQETLTAEGCMTVVAVEDESVVGFAFAMIDADGIGGYLSLMAVDHSHRRQGIARRLIEELFQRSKAERIDLLAEPGSEPFYESLPHRTLQGYRLYPTSF